MDNKIFENVDQYIADLFADEDDVLKGIDKSLADGGMPLHSISPNQGKFLGMLAQMRNARYILEIGTLGGYSTIWLARAMASNGKLITIELNPAHAAIAIKNFEKAGLDKVIDQRVGKDLDILQQLKEEGAGPFDMIFIDADKPPYVEYFRLALKLSRPGTIIVADNVIRGGKVLDQESEDPAVLGVQRFNKMLAGHPDVTATILQMVGVKEYDGMAVAVVKGK
jgi:caffeoyl-CoA O-methyltransferase